MARRKKFDWAENECRLACKRENPDYDFDSDEFDYGCACYKSALETYNVLMNQEHSGASFGFTKEILKDLLDGLPLTPITDNDFDIELNDPGFAKSMGLKSVIQCLRISSLFREEHKDGTILYKDIDRGYFVDIENPSNTWNGNLQILNELFPIRMPYYPPREKYRIYAQEFLCDKSNGDFDTVGIYYIITPKGERVEVNRFETTDEDGNWKEITKEEYEFLLHNKRIDTIPKKVAEHLLWTLTNNCSTDEEIERRRGIWEKVPEERKSSFQNELEKLCEFFEDPDNYKYNTFSMCQSLCKAESENYKDVKELVRIADFLTNVLLFINTLNKC